MHEFGDAEDMVRADREYFRTLVEGVWRTREELDTRLAAQKVSADVTAAIAAARGKFVAGPALERLQGEDRQVADLIVRASLKDAIADVMTLAAALALAGALCSAVAIPRPGAASATRIPETW